MSKPRPYATDTRVPAERSLQQITALVESIGAAEVVHGRQGRRHVFAFKLGARSYRYQVQEAVDSDRETRRRWRVLWLQIKARVELVREAGEAVEEAFMAHQLLPDGRTVQEAIGPQLASGEAPRLMLEAGAS